jgi:hypothetical protein
MPGYDQTRTPIANYDKLASGFDRIVLDVRACNKSILPLGRIKRLRFHPGEVTRIKILPTQVNLATSSPTTITVGLPV